jgi:hypothetical protein
MKYIIEKENTMTTRPSASEYASYYERYVSLVPEAAILTVLEQQTADVRLLVGEVRPDQETYRYAPNKWSVREILGHIIDGERVFGYRAFCISRGERSPLPSFDENEYIRASAYNTIPLVHLLEEFLAFRSGNIACLSRLGDKEWGTMGTASNHPITVRALAFIIGGHFRHHLNGIRGQYGDALQSR